MANLRPVPPLRRDEAQLFHEFNDELMVTVAFAWERSLVCQPERDMNWLHWRC